MAEGGVQVEGAVGGDKGNVQVGGGILEADQGEVEADKGMWGGIGSSEFMKNIYK